MRGAAAATGDVAMSRARTVARPAAAAAAARGVAMPCLPAGGVRPAGSAMSGPDASRRADGAAVREALGRYLEGFPDTTRYCVAYSGGMDSHALLHVAAELLGRARDGALRALHVDHALHPASADWARHARDVAASLGVPIAIERVRVVADGRGPEAAARAARHAAFARALGAGEHLLLAQHADDLAETFLLRALRGSGPDGLGAIRPTRTFAAGVMARPLLGCPRAALRAVAEGAALGWIEDPSNADTALDRNYLRHVVMPLLERRWPATTRTLGRAAGHCAAAAGTLETLARADLGRARAPTGDEIALDALRALPRERARAALRLWVREAGRRAPRRRDLEQVLDTLTHEGGSVGGVVGIGDYEIRRYRRRLFLVAPRHVARPYRREWRAPFADLALPEAGTTLTREGCRERGIALPADGVVDVASRRGGERIALGEGRGRRPLKKLLQEAGVPPWRRETIPLLWIEGQLAAVWGVAVAADHRSGRERRDARER